MSRIRGYENKKYRDHGARFQDSEDMEDPNMTLFAQQSKVERLPIPSLQHTHDLVLQSVRPHVSEAEFNETKRKIDELCKPGGLGEVLQKRLQQRKEDLPRTSWFIEWWNDYAYLTYRDSVVWNVSYYLQFGEEFGDAMASSRRRAARFLTHLLKFREQVVTGTLSPDMNKSKPMSNSQYKYMFHASRMPGENTDFVRTYAPDLYNHIIVVRKNRYYAVDVLDAKTGTPFSVDVIESQLNHVVHLADMQGKDDHGIGILTSANRDPWYANRCKLVQHGENAQALETIESAICVVCFDDASPVTRDEIGLALLQGDGHNRFWDKSIQLVFFENGKGGYIGEHAMMDGTTTTRLVNYCLGALFKDTLEVKRPSGLEWTSSMPSPRPVSFTLTPEIVRAVAQARHEFDALAATRELKVCMFHAFGKEEIKKFRVSPDAFAQVAIQLGYFKTFGQCRGTYESTQTRSFLHGRTEVTRSVTNESDAFCRAVCGGKTSAAECYKLLMAAAKAHVSYSSLASKGMGVDRHMLGLKMALKEGESAEIFSDPGWVRSATWALSTSGLVGEYMDGWGFGEVVSHGIGVAYGVLNHRLRFTITSRHRWADRICGNIERALLEMQYLCETQQPPVQSKL